MPLFFAWAIFICFYPAKATPCQPPDVPLGGSYLPIHEKYLPGDRVIYSCGKGFTRIGRESSSCQTTGKWTGPMPFCETPTLMRNPTAATDPKKSVRNVIDGLNSTCYTSNNTTGQMLQVFLQEANVITSIRLFLPKGSTKLRINISNKGSAKTCTHLNMELEENQWIQQECEDKQAMADSIKISDISPKSNILSICEIEVYVKSDVWCKDPPSIFIPNGHLEVSRDKASLRCNHGFCEGENTRLVCDKNNTWTGPNLQCNEIFCDLNGGNISGVEWRLEGKKPSVGSRRVLQCHGPDFVSTGEPTSITCQNDGTWTPTDAKCVRKGLDKDVMKIVGISVGAIIVFLIFLCLGLTLYCVYKQKRKEVVVVYTTADDTTTINSEPEYSSVYEKIITPPSRKKLPIRNIFPPDIPFGTLKSSALYGN